MFFFYSADSDSELSLDENQMGIELASSHSSDEEEDEFDNMPGWQFKPKNKILGENLNSRLG